MELHRLGGPGPHLDVGTQRVETAGASLKTRLPRHNDLAWDHCRPGTQMDHMVDTLRPPGGLNSNEKTVPSSTSDDQLK